MWELSPIDLEALPRWNDYSSARDDMIRRTHSDHAPWTVIRTNDKRHGRITLIQNVLHGLHYAGKDEKAIDTIDVNICFSDPDFLKMAKTD